MSIPAAIRSVRIVSLLALALAASYPAPAPAQETPAFAQPAWGRIAAQTNGAGLITLEVRAWPADGKLPLPSPFPEISAAHLLTGLHRIPLKWFFSPDAAHPQLEVPAQATARLPATIVLETGGKTAQWTGGRIVLAAPEAQIQGTKAKLESQPGNNYIGGWSDAAESVKWDFKPTRWGMYDLELAFAADGGAGTELQIEAAGRTFTVIRPATGGAERFTTIPVGRFYLAKAEPFTVSVACAKLKGGLVMNLKGLTLRPAPEGKPVVQDPAGAITLPASNAITHSVNMRYEPSAQKNCLGFWTNPKDWAEWEFRVTRPGSFKVEVTLGCGKGQGGSDISVEVAGETLPFVVEDTGDYHVHAVQRVGTVKLAAPGAYSLAVRPQHKKAGAIMDIEKVMLVPE